jgi:hypothetical protein
LRRKLGGLEQAAFFQESAMRAALLACPGATMETDECA